MRAGFSWGKTPDTPDEPDALDASDVVKEVVGDRLASGRRVRRVVWWFLMVGGVVVNRDYPRVCGGVMPSCVAVS